jgi:hypothetical protein
VPGSAPRAQKPTKPRRRAVGVAPAALAELLQELRAIRALPRRPLLGRSKAKPRKPSPLDVLPEPAAASVRGTAGDDVAGAETTTSPTVDGASRAEPTRHASHEGAGDLGTAQATQSAMQPRAEMRLTPRPRPAGVNQTLAAVEQALLSGKYRVDVDAGIIYGPAGHALKPTRLAGRVYATVSLSVRGMTFPTVTVPVHKLVAYALWRRAAFAPGIHVRHLNNDPTDNRQANLALGSPRDNAYDLPKEVRVRRLQQGRATQGYRGPSALLSDAETARLQEWARANGVFDEDGWVRRGAARDVAAALGMSVSAASKALRLRLPSP